MIIGDYEIIFGKREKILISAVIAAVLGIAFYSFYFTNQAPQTPAAPQSAAQNTPTGSSFAYLAPRSPISAKNCDVYISAPDKLLKYYSTISCDDLNSTKITKEELLNFGNNQKGVYYVTIFSEETNEGTNFSFAVN